MLATFALHVCLGRLRCNQITQFPYLLSSLTLPHTHTLSLYTSPIVPHHPSLPLMLVLHSSAPIGVIQQVISFIPNILFGRGIDRPVKQAITSTFGSAVYMEDWTRAKDNRVGVKVVVQPPIVKLRPYYVDVMDTYSAQDFEIIEREADPLTMSLVPFVAGFAMKKFPEYTDEEIRYQMIENTMAGSRQKEHVVL